MKKRIKRGIKPEIEKRAERRLNKRIKGQSDLFLDIEQSNLLDYQFLDSSDADFG